MDTYLLVEDHPLFRDAMLLALGSRFPEADLVSAESAEQGLELAVDDRDIKLVIVDMGLPGISGAEAVACFRQRCPAAILAVVSSSDDRREVTAAFRVGAEIFVSKATPTELLLDSISEALAGKLDKPRWVTPDGAAQTLAPLPELTDRQREILAEMMQGQSNKEIALRLDLSEVTVKMHVTAIFRALDVVNRTQAVLVARKLALDLATTG